MILESIDTILNIVRKEVNKELDRAVELSLERFGEEEE